jgi:hypothetical protein
MEARDRAVFLAEQADALAAVRRALGRTFGQRGIPPA